MVYASPPVRLWPTCCRTGATDPGSRRPIRALRSRRGLGRRSRPIHERRSLARYSGPHRRCAHTPAVMTLPRRRRNVPAASSETARLRMERQRARDTQPELAIRSALHRRGLRFRVHARPISGVRREADVIFPTQRIAVFIDGCYWHGCPDHATWPKQNADWWRRKIQSNRARDKDTDSKLSSAGWLPIRVWEHEDPEAAATRIDEVVRCRKPLTAPTSRRFRASPMRAE